MSQILKETILYYRDSGEFTDHVNHDKFYQVRLCQEDPPLSRFNVIALWGRREILDSGRGASFQIKYAGEIAELANVTFNKLIAQKKKKGYTEDPDG